MKKPMIYFMLIMFLQIIMKKYLRGLGEEKGRRRAVNGLVRLGYRYEDIKREISAVLEEYGEENSWVE